MCDYAIDNMKEWVGEMFVEGKIILEPEVIVKSNLDLIHHYFWFRKN